MKFMTLGRNVFFVDICMNVMRFGRTFDELLTELMTFVRALDDNWTKHQRIERHFDKNLTMFEGFIKYPYIHISPYPHIHGFPINSYK